MREGFELVLTQGQQLTLEPTLYIPREEVYANLGHNIYFVSTKTNLNIGHFANLIGREMIVVHNFIKLKPSNLLDAHLIYSFAKYAGTDINTFVSSKLELPIITSQKTGLITLEKMRTNFLHHLASLGSQMGVDIHSQPEFYKKFNTYLRSQSSLSIFKMHHAANVAGHNLDTLLGTEITTTLTPHPNRHRTIHLIAEPARVVVENARLINAKNTIIALLNNRQENLERLIQATGIEPNKIINFYPGKYTPNLEFMRKISDFYGYTVDDFLNLSFNELSNRHMPLTSRNTNSLMLNSTLDSPSTKFQKNLEYILTHQSIEQIEQRIGRKIPGDIRKANVTTAQDVANALGYSLHTFTSCEPAQLPNPDSSLIKKIMQKTAKMIVLGGNGLLLGLIPAMALPRALDAAVQNVANELNDHVDDLFDRDLPVNHPTNLAWKLLMLTGQCATDWFLLIDKTLDGFVQGVLRSALEDFRSDMSLSEHLLAPISLPLDIAQGTVEGYLEGARPIVAHTIEWLKTLHAFAPHLATDYYSTFDQIVNGRADQPSPARKIFDYFMQSLSNVARDLMRLSDNEEEELKSTVLNELTEIEKQFKDRQSVVDAQGESAERDAAIRTTSTAELNHGRESGHNMDVLQNLISDNTPNNKEFARHTATRNLAAPQSSQANEAESRNNSVQNRMVATNGRYQVNFEFNGSQHHLEVGLGLEIYVGTTAVVATSCHNGHCVITMRNGPDAYELIQTSYQPLNNNNQANLSPQGSRQGAVVKSSTADIASIERLQANRETLRQMNSLSSDLQINSSSTSSLLQSLSNLKESQERFNYSLSASHTHNVSQFTLQSCENYYCSSANEAARYTTFFSNYVGSGRHFKEKPVVANRSSFFSRGGVASDHGKKDYCDAFGNCYEGSGSNDNCRNSSSGKCESSLFK